MRIKLSRVLFSLACALLLSSSVGRADVGDNYMEWCYKNCCYGMADSKDDSCKLMAQSCTINGRSVYTEWVQCDTGIVSQLFTPIEKRKSCST